MRLVHTLVNRRRALQSLATPSLIIGGCLERRQFVAPIETTVRRDESTPRRTVAVASVSSDRLTAIDVTPSVEVVRSAVTEDHPASIRCSLSGEADGSRTLRRTVCPPADVHVANRADGNGRLALMLADEQSFEPAIPECWRPSLQDFQVGKPCGSAEVTVPAGETTTRTYEVWDHPKNESCMPSGEYEFGETYHASGREVEWRFTLAVESA